MPSSGTTAYSVTVDGMTNSALRSLRVLAEGAAANAAQLASGAEEINLILKTWTVKGLKLWCYQQILVPLVTAQITYTLGPSGANVTVPRPLRVFEYGNFIRYTVNGIPQDTPLNLLSRAEYMQFGAKQSPGVVNSIYYHPGIDLASGVTSPSTGYGTLYVYVAPSDATRTLYLNAQRALYDVTAGAGEFDLPAEWFLALKWALMEALADDNEVPEQRIGRITQKAAMYLAQASDWSVEEASTTFQPNFTGRY